MAWIRVIEQDRAGELLRDVYEHAGSKRGVVANILKVHSIKPSEVRAHLSLYMELMFGPSQTA